MPITTTISRVSYSGTGSVGPYLVPFRVMAATDLFVVHRDRANLERPLALTVDYLVAGVGQPQATITLRRSLADGERIAIRRAPPLTQPVSLRTAVAYSAPLQEDALDRITMQLQRLKDEIDRSVKLGETFDQSGMTAGLRPEPGKALVWQSATQLGNATIDGSAVALPGAGRGVATLSAYLLNNAIFNVKDYGATGDGATDDTSAVQQAIAAANAIAGENLAMRTRRAATVHFPPGSYLLSDTLTPFPGVTMTGSGVWSTVLLFAMSNTRDAIVFNRTTPGYERHQGFGWGGAMRDLKVTSADWNDPRRSCNRMVAVLGLVDFAMDRVMLAEGHGRLLHLESVVSLTLNHVSLHGNHGDCGLWIGSEASIATTVRAFHLYQSQCRNGPGLSVGGLSLDFYGLTAESNGIGGTKEGSHGVRVRFGKVGLYSPYFEDNADHDMCIGSDASPAVTTVVITNPTVQVSGTKLPTAGGVYLDRVAHATLQGGDLSACGRPVQITPNCGHADLSFHAPGKPPLLTSGAHWRTKGDLSFRGGESSVQTLTKDAIRPSGQAAFTIPTIPSAPAFLQLYAEITFEASANLRATVKIDISKEGDGQSAGGAVVTMIQDESAGNFRVANEDFVVTFERNAVVVTYASSSRGASNQARFFVTGIGIGGDVSLR